MGNCGWFFVSTKYLVLSMENGEVFSVQLQ